MAAALLDDLGQADDLGAGAHDDQKLQAAVVRKNNFRIIVTQHENPILYKFDIADF